MLVNFLDAILRRLASVWRSFGSPRIAGDEKAVDAVRSAWVNRGRVVEVRSRFSARARSVVVASSGLLVAAVVVWLVFAGFDAANDATGADGDGEPDVVGDSLIATVQTGPVYLTEVAALSGAVAAARENGLISDEFAHIARRIQFGAFAEAIGESYRAEQGLLVTSSDTEVWVIAFSGDVELKLAGGETVKYDNLTVVLDALTGQIYRVEAFYGEYESEARAPVWLKPSTPTPEPDDG